MGDIVLTFYARRGVSPEEIGVVNTKQGTTPTLSERGDNMKWSEFIGNLLGDRDVNIPNSLETPTPAQTPVGSQGTNTEPVTPTIPPNTVQQLNSTGENNAVNASGQNLPTTATSAELLERIKQLEEANRKLLTQGTLSGNTHSDDSQALLRLLGIKEVNKQYGNSSITSAGDSGGHISNSQ